MDKIARWDLAQFGGIIGTKKGVLVKFEDHEKAFSEQKAEFVEFLRKINELCGINAHVGYISGEVTAEIERLSR